MAERKKAKRVVMDGVAPIDASLNNKINYIEVNINEHTEVAERDFTCRFGPGPPELDWQSWETPSSSIPVTAVVQGCRCRAAGLQG